MPSKNQFKSHEEFLEYFRKYREKNREKVRIYNREYNRLWRKKNGYHNENKWQETNKTKVRAEKLLQYAVNKGYIKRKPCKICKAKKTHAHHPDYSKPLEVVFLCPLHHRQLHIKLKDKRNK